MSPIPPESDLDYLRRIEDEEAARIFAAADEANDDITAYRASLGVDPKAVTEFWREWIDSAMTGPRPSGSVALAAKAFSLGLVVGRDLATEESCS